MTRKHVITGEAEENEVIAYLTALCNVTADNADIAEVWLEVFSDTDVATAKQAIKAFAVNSGAFPSPANIRPFVTQIHEARLVADNHQPFPPDISDFDTEDDFNTGYAKWLAEWRLQVRLGADPNEADETSLLAIGSTLDRNAARPHEIEDMTMRLALTTGAEQ
ncbi:hypothetical protein GCM10025867_47690 (plasmid) [Frondihabitans sucicola]|uniref:Replicative helicase inhibitor G39P N-terminal domain-containing protein n=1 Tax=Frondihabitans sucicola TaxID=1268041 RepID=A0ABN6Y5S8_9MICO|nr:hypothetical protein [Frondihabitans sucicola]BDZ52528.1 hypothetical protein GCM10025867_47690 [Frondihabitans sucicola]